jgi:hypothetical protein
MNCESDSIESAIRQAWLVTAALFLLFVLAPYTYLYAFTPWADIQYDPNLNIIELLAIGGSASTLSFLVIAFRFSAKREKAETASPAYMRKALFSGLLITGGYWLFFLFLTSNGSDGDGIMRGWMLILFPFAITSYVLHVARQH